MEMQIKYPNGLWYSSYASGATELRRPFGERRVCPESGICSFPWVEVQDRETGEAIREVMADVLLLVFGTA